ncbi:MAG: hypothetical protein ACOC0B_01655 [bacterium]
MPEKCGRVKEVIALGQPLLHVIMLYLDRHDDPDSDYGHVLEQLPIDLFALAGTAASRTPV